MDENLKLLFELAPFVGIFVGGGWALFRYIGGRVDGVRRECTGLVVEAKKEGGTLLSEVKRDLSETLDKRCHALANNTQRVTDLLRTDVETLKREAVTKPELKAMEDRLSNTLDRLDTKLDAVTEKATRVEVIAAVIEKGRFGTHPTIDR